MRRPPDIPGSRFRMCAAAVLVLAPVAAAQVPILGSGPNGVVRIFNTDAAVLEVHQPRTDLACTVTPIKPVLGFDLRMHAGYEVSIPLRELAGSENLLTIIFRVTPEDPKEEPSYFSQRLRVPSIQEDAKGEAYFQGSFDIGEGKYHVDWLMRDRSERVCSDYWDVDAALPSRDSDVTLEFPPGVVGPTEIERFGEEPPVERAQGEPLLSVKILVNFAPQNAGAAMMQPQDTSALVSILRGICREPRIGKFSLTVFNLQEQKVLYRKENEDRIDFPALGGALRSLNLGTVDLRRLSQKHGDTQFLADLIRRETGPGSADPDALVFAGPKAMLEQNIPQNTLKELGELNYPVFYMNYNLDPRSNPWRDSIGYAVKFFNGTEFTISRPRDLWYAVTDMVSRIVKFRHDRRASAAPAQ